MGLSEKGQILQLPDPVDDQTAVFLLHGDTWIAVIFNNHLMLYLDLHFSLWTLPHHYTIHYSFF